MRTSEAFCLGIIALSVIVSVLFYPQLPDQMASHWDENGVVNGFMPKLFALAIMPVISLFLFGLFLLVPKIDPLGKNIKKFRRHYDFFVVLVIAFMAYINFLTLVWNLGWRFEMIQLLAPAMGVLFYCTGSLIEHAERNWFIGIRTPWTLSSERVWKKTHELGSKLFKAAGIIAVFGAVFPQIAFVLIIVPIIVVSVWAVVYSYLEFKKEKRKKRR